MLHRAASNNLVKGVLDQFRPGGIVSLQYADDTLLFSDVDVGYMRNLKIILLLFERISGMRNNFHKNEFIPLHVEDERVHEIAHCLNCCQGSLPFKYLGVPLHFEELKKEDVQPFVDKLVKRMAS
jgi:hypothetical protein